MPSALAHLLFVLALWTGLGWATEGRAQAAPAALPTWTITVRDGAGLIVTSFSPDTGSDDFTPLDALVSSMRWPPRS